MERKVARGSEEGTRQGPTKTRQVGLVKTAVLDEVEAIVVRVLATR